jgi:hypothetical protein
MDRALPICRFQRPFLAVTDSYSRRCGGGAFLSPSSQSWLSAKLPHALSIRLNRAFSWSVVALSASSPQFSAFLRIPSDDFSIVTSCRIFFHNAEEE